MKAIVKDQVGQTLHYMQTLQGQRLSALNRLARLAAEDEDTELGRLATQMAMECLNADHNVVVLSAPYVPVAICRSCATELVGRFRNIFGAWMTAADQNRLDFMLHEITGTIAQYSTEVDCAAHRAPRSITEMLQSITDVYTQDFIDEDDDDEL